MPTRGFVFLPSCMTNAAVKVMVMLTALFFCFSPRADFSTEKREIEKTISVFHSHSFFIYLSGSRRAKFNLLLNALYSSHGLSVLSRADPLHATLHLLLLLIVGLRILLLVGFLSEPGLNH